MATYLCAREAAAELGVSLPTLYAYVSRGLIRSEREGAARRRRYLAEDVWLLNERKRGRRDPARRGAGRAALGHAGARVAALGDSRRPALLRRARRGGAGGACDDRAGRGAAVVRRHRFARCPPKRSPPTPPSGAARRRWRDGCRRSKDCSSSCRWRRRAIRSRSTCGRRRCSAPGRRILRILAAAAVGARPTAEPVARRPAAALGPARRRRRAPARRRAGALRRQRPQPVELHGALRRLGGLDAVRGGGRRVGGAAGRQARRCLRARRRPARRGARRARRRGRRSPRGCGAAKRCPGSAIRSIPTAIRAPRTCSSSSPRTGRPRPRWRACARSSTPSAKR